ncbi:pyridoxal-phosphate dependent enzyme [Thermococcus sp. 21S7]|uniref:pyridoxal-phosphate dependent enzyme n=1 Tax=Thermococcus sp. 21S7 TaxID=1638221 RepID=UPI001439C0F2|nr:pyridoxal-phosphate dependent enzyme [Thermococcus sp. 21S7]NJE61700.1 pyridoxal-phosphate dependent enzyme [Thermococcus sp. 21S7]
MLVCSHCGKVYRETFRLTCDCGGTLLVKRNHVDFFGSLLPHLDMRRYLNLLPVNEDCLPPATPAITPVSTLPIGQVSGFVKLEYLQPSGSFKDRGTWVTVAKLREEGITEVVIDSSGNAALSFALYGLASGIRVHTFVSYDTLPGKLSLLQHLGAVIHFVDGDRMAVHGRAVEFAEKSGITYVSHWLNPYFLEGTKTAAVEVYEQLGVPDYVIAPTGSGTLFLGLWKGFSELKDMGEIDRLPRLVAVQASGYESLCERSPMKNEAADGIAIPEPPRLREMRRAVKETSGLCVSVDELETMGALNWLKRHGFIVEPTSAVVLAALWKLMESGEISAGSRVLLPLTGSGLKMVKGI